MNPGVLLCAYVDVTLQHLLLAALLAFVLLCAVRNTDGAWYRRDNGVAEKPPSAGASGIGQSISRCARCRGSFGSKNGDIAHAGSAADCLRYGND